MPALLHDAGELLYRAALLTIIWEMYRQLKRIADELEDKK